MKLIKKDRLLLDIRLKEKVINEELKIVDFLIDELKKYDLWIVNNRIVNNIRKEHNIIFNLEKTFIPNILKLTYSFKDAVIRENGELFYSDKRKTSFNIMTNEVNRLGYHETKRCLETRKTELKIELMAINSIEKHHIENIIQKQKEIIKNIEEFNNYLSDIDQKTYLLSDFKIYV